MVRTGNVDFSCKRLTSIGIRKSKYHIIRRARFRWDTPLRKISGSALAYTAKFMSVGVRNNKNQQIRC